MIDVIIHRNLGKTREVEDFRLGLPLLKKLAKIARTALCATPE